MLYFGRNLKKGFGVTVNPTMVFNLEEFFDQDEDPSDLISPFGKKEIDDIIVNLPCDKAPGPDAFNGYFVKKTWHTLRDDFYVLYQDFYNHSVDMKSINALYITLVPKKDNPEVINDFMPISLLNTSFKLIIKTLSNRLQKKILRLVHENQYGFIKTKSIQDYLGWAFEYPYQCKHSRREIVILKLDFEKDFYVIEHSTS